MPTSAALVLLALVAPAAPASTAPPGGRVAALAICHGAGDVRVRGQRGAGVRLVQRVREGGDGCRVTWRATGAGLRLDGPAAPGCRVDLEVWVAPSTAVTVRLAEGRLEASGLRADLELTVGRGGAVVGGRCGALRASLEAGSLSATGMFGSVVLSLAAGNAQLWFTEPPRQSFVTLDVGRGNVTIGAPDTAVTSRAQLAEGHLRGGADGGAGRLEVTGSIGHGDLILRGGR